MMSESTQTKMAHLSPGSRFSMQVDQENAYRGLASAIIRQSLKDVMSTNLHKRLDAAVFLIGTGQVYCDLLNIEAKKMLIFVRRALEGAPRAKPPRRSGPKSKKLNGGKNDG
jgi:dihydrofolate reductase